MKPVRDHLQKVAEFKDIYPQLAKSQVPRLQEALAVELKKEKLSELVKKFTNDKDQLDLNGLVNAILSLDQPEFVRVENSVNAVAKRTKEQPNTLLTLVELQEFSQVITELIGKALDKGNLADCLDETELGQLNNLLKANALLTGLTTSQRLNLLDYMLAKSDNNLSLAFAEVLIVSGLVPQELVKDLVAKHNLQSRPGGQRIAASKGNWQDVISAKEKYGEELNSSMQKLGIKLPRGIETTNWAKSSKVARLAGSLYTGVAGTLSMAMFVGQLIKSKGSIVGPDFRYLAYALAFYTGTGILLNFGRNDETYFDKILDRVGGLDKSNNTYLQWRDQISSFVYGNTEQRQVLTGQAFIDGVTKFNTKWFSYSPSPDKTDRANNRENGAVMAKLYRESKTNPVILLDEYKKIVGRDSGEDIKFMQAMYDRDPQAFRSFFLKITTAYYGADIKVPNDVTEKFGYQAKYTNQAN
jgi:hypothetical protein